MESSAQVGKIINKYLIIDVFAYADQNNNIMKTLISINKAYRQLLKKNYKLIRNMTSVDILHVKMGNFVSSRDPFNELSFLYSEQALRLKKFHVSIIKKFEHLESLQYYLSLIPRTNGQLVSLTLSHCAYEHFLENCTALKITLSYYLLPLKSSNYVKSVKSSVWMPFLGQQKQLKLRSKGRILD